MPFTIAAEVPVWLGAGELAGITEMKFVVQSKVCHDRKIGWRTLKPKYFGPRKFCPMLYSLFVWSSGENVGRV
jgi:hypothetical protein